MSIIGKASKNILLRGSQGQRGSGHEDLYEISEKCLRNWEYSICDDFEKEFQYWSKFLVLTEGYV